MGSLDEEVVQGEPVSGDVTELRREHARCDDRISLFYAPIDTEDEAHESSAESIFDGLVTGADDNPRLYKLLFDIDQKLNLLLKHMSDSDGFALPEATDVNISGGGLRFVSKESFTEGALLRIKTVLPNLAGKVDLKCEVVRSTAKENGTYEVAVKYLDLSEATREIIIKYIFATQRKQLRSERSIPTE
ncbi:MAG: PilZ domain-containing protein [Proteobacteria bacterium]|nr:PilZ domain-containing protein [Pseudomonadota bacterium]